METSRRIIEVKYYAGIVTYNPDIKRLEENIDAVSKQVELVIICDNASENLNEITKLTKKYQNIIIIRNKNNYGIAYALNRIFKKANEDGIRWVLTLDQDTIIPDQMIEKFSRFVDERTIGIICPLFRDPKIDYGSINTNDEDVEEVSQAITSGCLTNVEAWEKVEGFDEKMFIDFVDYDFCYRIKKDNYKIVEIKNVVLNHTIGNAKSISFFGKKVIVTNHSDFRKYYIVRNYIYYTKKNNIENKELKKAMLKKVIKTIIFESGRFKTAKAYLKGWIDGNKICRRKGWQK